MPRKPGRVEVDPGRVDQVRLAESGRLVTIDKDVGGVTDDLKRIDKGFKVEFPPDSQDPVWIVYHEGHAGCPHNGAGGEHSTYLVATYRAYQNASGVWEGLDQRVVKRMLEVGHSSYDYAKELEAHNRKVAADEKKAASERIGEMAEQAAHAIRKDLGLGPYKGRIFSPKEI